MYSFLSFFNWRLCQVDLKLKCRIKVIKMLTFFSLTLTSLIQTLYTVSKRYFGWPGISYNVVSDKRKHVGYDGKRKRRKAQGPPRLPCAHDFLTLSVPQGQKFRNFVL